MDVTLLFFNLALIIIGDCSFEPQYYIDDTKHLNAALTHKYEA